MALGRHRRRPMLEAPRIRRKSAILDIHLVPRMCGLMLTTKIQLIITGDVIQIKTEIVLGGLEVRNQETIQSAP